MTSTPAQTERRPTRRRRWWIVVLLAVGLLLAAGGVGWWATRPPQLRRIVAAVLADATGAQVRLRHAQLSWSRGLQLTGLAVSVPDTPHGEFFVADEVHIDLAMLWTLVGSAAADDLVLVRPTFYMTEDPATGRYLFERLLGRGDDTRITRAPQVRIEQGRIIFRELTADGGLEQLGALELAGELTRAPDDPDEYHFELRQIKDQPVETPTLHGQFNLRDSTFTAAIDGFRFEQPQRFFLRHELRRWWRRLDPQGAFSQAAVAYDPEHGWQVQLVLEQAALNVPMGDYRPRMTDVTGRMSVERHSLVIDQLEGVIEGLRYRVTGRVMDLRQQEAVAFTLSAETDWFEIEPDPGVVDRLPPIARKYYDRFQPAGRFQLELTADRDQPGGPIAFNGLVRLDGVSGVYHKFPYPAHDVEGVIRFNSEQITIEKLTGKGPTGATVAFESGRIFPPGDGASVQVELTAADVPIDQHLRAAMEPDHLRVLDEFLDDRQRQAIVDAGVLDEDWRPGGVIKQIRVRIDRPYGEHVHADIYSTIDVAGLRMIYRHWPYPMTAQRGTLAIAPDKVEVDVELVSPTGGGGRVVGKLDRVGDDLTPDLRIEDAGVPIDDLLIASMPRPQDQWLRDLRITGELRGAGRVFKPADGGVDFELDGRLVDGRVTPYGGDFTLDQVAGDLTLQRNRLTIHRLAGRRNDAAMTLSGGVDWSGEPMALDLQVRADDLPISRDVLDLLPPDHEQRRALLPLFDRYEPQGVVDAQLDYRKQADAEYELTLSPEQLSVQLDAGRIAFERMTGGVVIEPGRVRLDQIAGRFDDDARLEATGQVTLGDQPTMDLRLSGESVTIGPTLRAMLPGRVRDTIDALKLESGVMMRDARLVRDGELTTFDADLRLIGASVEVGVPVRRLDGQLQVRVDQRHDQDLPHVELDLHADRLVAADRLVRLLDVRLASGAGGRVMRLEQFIGAIYGGALVGHGAIELESTPRYRFRLTLEDVELGPFLEPIEARTEPRFEPHPVDEPSFVDSPQRQTDTGLMSASLSIEAVAGHPESRVGRGAIEIRDARLYNQPLPLAVLQTLNLSLPTDRSFNSASARYLIDGDAVQFDTIRFDAPSLAVSGSGAMDWPSKRLDLAMVTRNPAMPNLGLVGEVINKVKDELVGIRITGTLAQPQGRAVTMSGLRRSWDELFAGTAARIRRDQVESAATP